MADKIEAKVRSTKHYDKFIAFRGNRGHKPARLAKLMLSMKENGWFNSLPMTVKPSKSDGKFDVMDGHTRFAAAQQLGIPAKYVIVNGEVTEETIYLINATQKNWSVLDYVESYANQGRKHYVTLLKFMHDHGAGLSNSISLLSGKQVCGRDEIKAGIFEVVDMEWAIETVNHLKRINSAITLNAMKGKFVEAYLTARKVSDFNEERFIDQVTKNPDLVIDLHNASDIADMFERIYNYRLSVKNQVPLAFNIKQARKGSKQK